MHATTSTPARHDRPDLTSYRAVHSALRIAPHRMAIAVRTIAPGEHRRVKAFTTYWRGYAEEVLMHHGLEDDVFFPALVARAPEMAPLMEQADAEHHELDERMSAAAAAIGRLGRDATRPVREAAAEQLEALAALMDAHLDLEDEEVLPAFEELLSVADYAVLEEQAMKAMKLGPQAAFAVPFVVSAVPVERHPQLFASAPAALRVLYRLTRGHHARLTARALGESGFLQAVRS